MRQEHTRYNELDIHNQEILTPGCSRDSSEGHQIPSIAWRENRPAEKARNHRIGSLMTDKEKKQKKKTSKTLR